MAKRNEFSLGEFFLTLMFGKHIGHSPEELASPTYNYQKRQNKLVLSGSLIGALFGGAMLYFITKGNVALGVALAFVMLRSSNWYMTASASDAIFDSLFERINLQSNWLHCRLTGIENRLAPAGQESSQTLWQEHPMQLDDAYRSYPEKA
jgi:hypothetical protein